MGVVTLAVLIAGPTAAQAAGKPGNSTSSGIWLAVAIALLGSSVLGGLITSIIGNLRAAATARRDGYAEAVRSLIARAEYPYRVRRRVSDDPEVLAGLVALGHDLQERLAACRTWINSEHRRVGTMFQNALAAIDSSVKASTADAWSQPPIKTASGMNLVGWGPGDQWPHLESLERAIAYRFGWRRAIPGWLWQRWV